MSVSITAIDRVDLSSFISKLKSGPLTQDQIYFEYCNLVNEYPFVQQLLRKQPSQLLFTKLIQQDVLLTDDLARIQREFLSFLSFVELKIGSEGPGNTGVEKQSPYKRNLDTGGIKNENHAQSAVKLIQSQKTLRRQFIHELVHGDLFNHVAESEKSRVEELIKKEAELYSTQKVSSVARRFLQEQHPAWIRGENESKINSMLRALETRESGVFGRITSQARSPEYLEVVKQNQAFFKKFDPYLAQTKHYKAIEQGLKLIEEDLAKPVADRKINNPEVFVSMLLAVAQSDPYVEVVDTPTFSKKSTVVLDEGADQTPFASSYTVVEKAIRLSNALSFSEATSVEKGVEGKVLVTMLETSINDYYKSLGKEVPDNAAAIIKSFNTALEDPSGKGTIPGGSITFSEAQRRILQGAFINLEADQGALVELLGEEFVKSKIYQEMLAKTKQDYVGKHLEGTPSQANKKLDLEKVKDISFFQSMFKSKEEAEKALGVPVPQELWGLKIPGTVAISQVKAFKAMLSLGIDHPDFSKTFGDYIKSLPGYKEGAPLNTNALVIFKFLELDAMSLSPENQYLWYVFLNDPKNVEVQELLKLHGIQDLTKALPGGEKGFSKMDKVHAAITAANLAYMAVTHPDAAFMFALGLGGQIILKRILTFAAGKLAAKFGVAVFSRAVIGTMVRTFITGAFSAVLPPIVGQVAGLVASYLVEKFGKKAIKVSIKVALTILLLAISPFLMAFLSYNPQSLQRVLLTEELGKAGSSSGENSSAIDCTKNPTDPICMLCSGADGKYDIKKCPWPVATGCVSQTDHSGHKTERGGSAIDIGKKAGAIPVNGQPVFATYPGVVIEARWSFEDNKRSSGPDFGNMVRIKTSTDPSFTVIYAHLRKTFSVKSGDVVSPGTIIGYVDSTGWFGDGPHLHMETHGVRIASVVPSITKGVCW